MCHGAVARGSGRRASWSCNAAPADGPPCAGARSQAARTYLERRFESFEDLTLDELIVHALLSLRETLASGLSLTTGNVAIGYVSAETDFTLVEDEAVQPYLDMIGQSDLGGDAPAGAPMEE